MVEVPVDQIRKVCEGMNSKLGFWRGWLHEVGTHAASQADLMQLKINDYTCWDCAVEDENSTRQCEHSTCHASASGRYHPYPILMVIFLTTDH